MEIIKETSQNPKLEFQLKIHPGAYLRDESTLGNIHLQLFAPSSPYYVMFIAPYSPTSFHDGAFFCAAIKDKKTPVIDSMQIFSTKELLDLNEVHLIEMIWSEDSLKAALLIDQHFHAVFDFEAFRGYCRTNIASVAGGSRFKNSHKWSDHAINWFLTQPILFPDEEYIPTPAEKRDEFIKSYLNPTLKKWGYQTSGQNWWKNRGDFFIVINLQNSRWNSPDHVSFVFNIGIALTSSLKDPEKKKAGYDDINTPPCRQANFLSESRKRHRFKEGWAYELTPETDLSEFIMEMKQDLESEILPILEKWETLNDVIPFYEECFSGHFWETYVRKMVEQHRLFPKEEHVPTAEDKQKEFINSYLKPTLKKWGYQTSGQTWWKNRGDFFIVIKLKNSSWNHRDHVLFNLKIGVALTSSLKDPEKNKASYDDLKTGAPPSRQEYFLSKSRKRHRFKERQGYELLPETDLSEFIMEMKQDLESEILPTLDKWETLNDVVKYYEEYFTGTSGTRVKEIVRERLSSKD